MNERIRELQHQCWVKVPCDFDMRKGGLSTINTVFDYEKFAELIVEECVNLMENQREHYYSKILGQQSAEHYDRIISKGDAFDEAANIIRSHFRS